MRYWLFAESSFFQVGDRERSTHKGANEGGSDPQYIQLSLKWANRPRYQQNKTATKRRLISTGIKQFHSATANPFQADNQLADRHLWRKVKQNGNVIRLPVKYTAKPANNLSVQNSAGV